MYTSENGHWLCGAKCPQNRARALKLNSAYADEKICAVCVCLVCEMTQFLRRGDGSLQNADFFGASEIADVLNICYANALSFIKYSGIHYVRLGRSYRVKKDVFYDFINNHTEINIDEFKKGQ